MTQSSFWMPSRRQSSTRKKEEEKGSVQVHFGSVVTQLPHFFSVSFSFSFFSPLPESFLTGNMVATRAVACMVALCCLAAAAVASPIPSEHGLFSLVSSCFVAFYFPASFFDRLLLTHALFFLCTPLLKLKEVSFPRRAH